MIGEFNKEQEEFIKNKGNVQYADPKMSGLIKEGPAIFGIFGFFF